MPAATLRSISINTYGESLDCLAASPDGEYVAVGWGCTVVVIRGDQKIEHAFKHTIENLEIANGGTVIASGLSHRYTVVHLDGYEHAFRTRAWVMGVTISGDGTRIAAGQESGHYCIRQWDQAKDAYRELIASSIPSSISTIALASDGKGLGIGTKTGDVYIMDLTDNTLFHFLVPDQIVSMTLSASGLLAARGLAHSYIFDEKEYLTVSRAAISDGKAFAVISNEGAVTLRTSDGRSSPLEPNAEKVTLARDGTSCVTTAKNQIIFWTREGEEIARLGISDDPATLIFAGQTIAWTDSSPNVHLLKVVA